ncbi:stalk domain-containing protein [Paenibacillus sp. MMO-177]|uniref:stalk domain-containing protein n=1 Tax=Paenibacillus sp. MMO-177 TaxID=3081289 RepID=UPI00301A46D1
MNEYVKSFTKINLWHDAGYKGQGVKIALSDLSATKYNPNWFPNADIVVAPSEQYRITTDTINQPVSHLGDQIGALLVYAPEAEIHIVSSEPDAKLQYLIDNDIDIYSHSTTAAWNNDKNNAQEKAIINAGNLLITAAGNTDDGAFISLGYKSTWISVGACKLGNYGDIVRCSYSCFDKTGNSVDALAFSDYQYAGGGTGIGTSFAAPAFAGMMAVWRGAFKKLHGRKPTYVESNSFIKDNAIPVKDEYPTSTGCGVVVMPSVMKNTIKLWIDSKNVEVNGEKKTIDSAPIESGGVTRLPIRDLTALMGYSVAYDKTDRSITLVKQT